MSDETIGSSQQAAVEPEHRTPDLMDNDPLLENLKALHEETKSDDETPDDGQPSTSEPKRCSPADGIIIHQRKNSDPGKFMWIWLLGIRVPALKIDGEPNLPIEILDEVLARQNPADAIFFQNLLRNKNVYVRMGTQKQLSMVNEKSDVCRQLKITTMSMMSRSDIERIMGELRRESRTTKVEHDDWNPKDRVHVVHVNFIDYCDKWLESEDLEEDPTECGTHGYWYKNRQNMRCIECRECEGKFTPPDFIMHHHFPLKTEGLVHHGLRSSTWREMIEVHKDDQSEANVAAWRMFRSSSSGMIKRSYAEAEPQEPRKIARVEYGKAVDGEDQPMHIADFLGPSGSKGLKPRDKLEELIINSLNKLDEESLNALFLKSPEDFYTWIRESDFAYKVVAQQEEWRARMKHPNYKSSASANFDVKKGEFENMREYDNASKSTKQEIQQLAEQFSQLDKEAKDLTPMEYIKKEHNLLVNLSSDALRVLSNKSLPPPPPPPMPKPKVVTPVQPVPISLGNINLLQIAQQLLASGIKIPLPIVPPQPVIVPSPAPVIPTIPTLPISPSVELLKQHISLALSSPSLFPMFYPKLPTSAYEQLSQFLKATAVKN